MPPQNPTIQLTAPLAFILKWVSFFIVHTLHTPRCSSNEKLACSVRNRSNKVDLNRIWENLSV